MYNLYFVNFFYFKDYYYFLPVKSQPGDAYRKDSYEKKKAFNVVLMPSKHEKITFPHEFVFVHMSFK